MRKIKWILASSLLLLLAACGGGGGGATTGTLQVNISGLPAGVNAAVVVTKPGGSTQNLTATATISNAAVGSYSVAASPVVSGGTFNAVVSGSPANVTAGNTSTVTVTYSLAAAGCPTPAVFDNAACTFDTATFGP